MSDLNGRPSGCKPDALTAELTALRSSLSKALQLFQITINQPQLQPSPTMQSESIGCRSSFALCGPVGGGFGIETNPTERSIAVFYFRHESLRLDIMGELISSNHAAASYIVAASGHRPLYEAERSTKERRMKVGNGHIGDFTKIARSSNAMR
jgi:hypothetical protein